MMTHVYKRVRTCDKREIIQRSLSMGSVVVVICVPENWRCLDGLDIETMIILYVLLLHYLRKF
jgi:hypothetical protein